jgi:hypothetical protein
MRSICSLEFKPILLWDTGFIIVFTVIVGWFAIRRLNHRLVR